MPKKPSAHSCRHGKLLALCSLRPVCCNKGPAQVRTLEQVRQIVAGAQALEFRRAEDDQGRYEWIESALRRFDYRQLERAGRGLLLVYLQHLSGYSRAQVTRVVSRWMDGKWLVKQYRAPEHAFARRYTAADVALLADVNRCLPQPACCAASAMPSAMCDSSSWVRFRWPICTTFATARRTAPSALCWSRPGRPRLSPSACARLRRPRGARASSASTALRWRQEPVSRQQGGLPDAVAGGGHRPDDLRCPPAARH